MIDLLIDLFRNVALHTIDAEREDYVLVVGINHRQWFEQKVLPIMEYERFHKSKNHEHDRINGIKIEWTEEHPNLFLFIERKHINLETE